MADVSHHTRKTHNKSPKRRCEEPKCAKLSRDFYQGKYLCRVHSPYREGTIRRLNEEAKKKNGK